MRPGITTPSHTVKLIKDGCVNSDIRLSTLLTNASTTVTTITK